MNFNSMKGIIGNIMGYLRQKYHKPNIIKYDTKIINKESKNVNMKS